MIYVFSVLAKDSTPTVGGDRSSQAVIKLKYQNDFILCIFLSCRVGYLPEQKEELRTTTVPVRENLNSGQKIRLPASALLLISSQNVYEARTSLSLIT